MKWTDCNADNPDFTSRYDAGARTIKDALGAYDTIGHRIYERIQVPCPGVSIRRWFKNRTIPLHIVCTLLEILDEEAPGNALDIYAFFPYLAEHTGDGIFQ